MRNLVDRLAEARPALEVEWSTRDELRMLAAIERRRRHQRRARAVAMFMPVLALLVIAGFGVRQHGLFRATPVASVASAGGLEVAASAAAAEPSSIGRVVRLEDGSSATLLQEDSELVLAHAEPDDVKLRLDRGAAAFDVVPSLSRTFRVESAGVEVIVLGTAFTVERGEGAVAVAVQRGRVRVIDATGDTVLSAGESRSFEPVAPSTPIVGLADDTQPGASASDSASPRGTRSPNGSSGIWRSFAERGDYEKAYGQLKHAGRAAVRDDVSELWLAADAARISGHPSDSLVYLRLLTKGHRRDARAPLAAFTLGRVLLKELGRPREAADAFADAQRLAPEGSLYEDALAREVEAWYRAGSVEQVKQRAAIYLARFPSGRWATAVRQYAGAE